MSDQSNFPNFKEFAKGEGVMWKDVFSYEKGLVGSVEEAGFAAGFALLWPGITALNKVLGSPPDSKSAELSHLDMSAHPVHGIDSRLK